MRITWASSSSQLDAGIRSAPQPAQQSGKQGLRCRARNAPATRASKRASTPQYKRDEKIQAVQDAKRREEVKCSTSRARNNQESNRVRYPFVFVGNLKPSITEERLKALFDHCGIIHRIEIRCSRGQAITMGVVVPEEVLTSRDRQYASIEFTNSKAARLALRLNGSSVDNCNIVVSSAPADLPEVQDIVCTRLGKLSERQGLPNPYKSTSSRPITIESTQKVDNLRTDRHRALGISFAKCVV